MKRLISVVLAIPLVIWSLPGQTPPREPSPDIRSASSEVLLDLVVRDKKGKAVRDLKPEELEVMDDGVSVKLKSLRMTDGSAPNAEPAALNPLRDIRLISLVFEKLDNDARRLAHEAAMEAIKAGSGPNVYFSVLSINQRLRLVQQFTNDRQLLKAAIDSAVGGGKTTSRSDGAAPEAVLRTLAGSKADQDRLLRGDSSQLNERGPDAALARLMVNLLLTSEQMAREERARPSIQALLALAKGQSDLPGRKSVIYFCQGLQVTSKLTDAFRAIIGAANRNNVTIYTVDATGLASSARNAEANDLLASAMQASADTATKSSDQPVKASEVKAMDTAMMAMTSNSLNPLADLAQSTGGFLIADSNDMRKPMRRIAEEVNSYYEAAYALPDIPLDGRFRKISVKVLRPHVKVQTRTGYFAIPTGPKDSVQPFEMPLLKALNDKSAENPLSLRCGTVRIRQDETGLNGALVIEAPLGAVQFDEDPATKTYKMHLSTLALIKDSSGKVVQKLSRDVPYTGALDRLSGAREGNFILNQPFHVAPGEYKVEAAVMDRLSGIISLQRSSFTVEPKREPLGSITLVRRMERATDQDDPEEPFRYYGSRVVPTLAPVVKGGKGAVVSTYFVIQPQEGSKEAPKLELEFLHDGQSLSRTPMKLPEVKGGARIPFLASIPLDSLSDGQYEMKAILEQDGKVSEESIEFALDAPKILAVAAAEEHVAGVNDAANVAAGAPAAVESMIRPIAVTASPAGGGLSQDDQAKVIAAARDSALNYAKLLPDFLCTQSTQRYVDAMGRSVWKKTDQFTELLRFIDGKEEYSLVERNGQRIKAGRNSLKGVLSTGEFGMLLRAVFKPESKAEFTFKGMAEIGGEQAYVFAFRVKEHDSMYHVTYSGTPYRDVISSFHGEVVIDEPTLRTRRISVETDGLPPKFPIQQSAMELEYSEVAIGDHDFLLPMRAQVRIREGKRRVVRNEIEFKKYRRFMGKATIQF